MSRIADKFEQPVDAIKITPGGGPRTLLSQDILQQANDRIEAGEDRDKVITELAMMQVELEDELREEGLLPPEKEMRHAGRRAEGAVHAAADAAHPGMLRAVKYAFDMGRKAYKSGGVDAAVEAVRRGLVKALPAALLATMKAGGDAALGELRTAGDVEGHEFHGNQWTSGAGGGEVSRASLDKTFPPAGKVVDGLTVRAGVPNESSVESSLDDYEVLPGVREVKMSEMDPDYEVKPYSTSESNRLDRLEKQIRENKEISPLIVVIDKDKHPYILEGGHRYDALRRMGVKSFPAQVVVDTRSVTLRGAALRILRPQEKGKPHSTEGPFGLAFNVEDPRAIEWAKEHAAELAKGISETTRELIADAVSRAVAGEGIDAAYDDILEAVGSEARADMIARTEVMTAANEGQREGWEQAIDAGLLPDTARRVWIETSEACSECKDLDGEEAEMDGEYPNDGGDGPPLHPNCRCTEGLAF